MIQAVRFDGDHTLWQSETAFHVTHAKVRELLAGPSLSEPRAAVTLESVPHESDPRFLVLHGTRLKGFAEAPAIAVAVGLDVQVVAERLDKLAADDLVIHRQGRLAGWTLTSSGRAEQLRLAAADVDAAGATAAVRDAYDRFLVLNRRLLAACTDWQVKAGAANAHADAGYDAEVVDRLAAIHADVAPVIDDLAGVLSRYATYRHRLDQALRHVRDGEREFFTKPLIDSYHTIWFELHEDLLSSLGIERSEEPVR